MPCLLFALFLRVDYIGDWYAPRKDLRDAGGEKPAFAADVVPTR